MTVEKHFPYLNVGQTLRFAVNLRAPGTRHGGKAGKDFVNNTTDVLATSFGLKHTLVTRVGDDYIRGVSGGERKRVSIAEAVSLTVTSIRHIGQAVCVLKPI